MGFEVGDREAVERAIRNLILIPMALISAIAFAGLLKDYVPGLFGAVIGGAAGGAIGGLLGEGAVRLTRKIWPPRE